MCNVIFPDPGTIVLTDPPKFINTIRLSIDLEIKLFALINSGAIDNTPKKIKL